MEATLAESADFDTQWCAAVNSAEDVDRTRHMSRDIHDSFERGTREFLQAWYGIELPDDQQQPGTVPEALRLWWNWQACSAVSFTLQNHILAELRKDGDFTVFYVENQGVVEWGYPTNHQVTDPAVFERQNDGQAAWHPVNMSLPQFLRHIAAFEANVSAEHAIWLHETTPTQIQELTKDLTEIDTSAIKGMQLFIGDDSIVTLHDKTMAIYASPNAATAKTKRTGTWSLTWSRTCRTPPEPVGLAGLAAGQNPC